MNVPAILQILKTFRVVIASAVLGLVALVILVLRMGAADELAKELEESSARLDEIRRNSRFAAALEADVEKMAEYVRRLDESLVDSRTRASNYAYFDDLGERCGVPRPMVDQIVVVVREGDEKRRGKPEFNNFSVVQFRIGVEGGFNDVVRFIDKVQDDRFLVRIERLSISSSESITGRMESASMLISVLAPKEGAK
jgi:hypothetical protein